MKGIIRGVFNPDNRLSNYNLLNNEIEAIEVLNRGGRDAIRDYYRINESHKDLIVTTHLGTLLTESERVDESRNISSTTISNSRR